MKLFAIKENHLYSKAYTHGKKFVGRFVIVYILTDFMSKRLAKANPMKEKLNRVGITVTKKLGGAVERNRAKRIIRAGYSEIQEKLKKGNLIVISAKPEISGKKSQEIAKELKYAFRKLQMIEEENQA